MSNVHVLPFGDLIEHELQGDDCPCGPLIEPVKCNDGSIGWVLTHHSLDGREHRTHNRLTQNLGPCGIVLGGYIVGLGVFWHSVAGILAGVLLWLAGCARSRREIDNSHRRQWICVKARSW